MRWGIIAFVDVLGFKGMWKRVHSPEDVFDSLGKVKNLASHLRDQQNAMWGGDLWPNLDIDVRLFSDTVVVSCVLPEGFEKCNDIPDYEDIRRYMLLRYMVLLLTSIITKAVLGKVPLLYRGCLAAGDYLMNEFCMLGPAVDEAGNFFEQADGAFIFLAPSAANVFRQRPGLLARAAFPYFIEYDVPMKRSSSLRTFAINPLLFVEEEKRAVVQSLILEVFGNDATAPSDIVTKRDNTKRFLDYLDEYWPMCWPNRGDA